MGVSNTDFDPPFVFGASPFLPPTETMAVLPGPPGSVAHRLALATASLRRSSHLSLLYSTESPATRFILFPRKVHTRFYFLFQFLFFVFVPCLRLATISVGFERHRRPRGRLALCDGLRLVPGFREGHTQLSNTWRIGLFTASMCPKRPKVKGDTRTRRHIS